MMLLPSLSKKRETLLPDFAFGALVGFVVEPVVLDAGGADAGGVVGVVLAGVLVPAIDVDVVAGAAGESVAGAALDPIKSF